MTTKTMKYRIVKLGSEEKPHYGIETSYFGLFRDLTNYCKAGFGYNTIEEAEKEIKELIRKDKNVGKVVKYVK